MKCSSLSPELFSALYILLLITNIEITGIVGGFVFWSYFVSLLVHFTVTPRCQHLLQTLLQNHSLLDWPCMSPGMEEPSFCLHHTPLVFALNLQGPSLSLCPSRPNSIFKMRLLWVWASGVTPLESAGPGWVTQPVLTRRLWTLLSRWWLCCERQELYSLATEVCFPWIQTEILDWV